MEKKDNSGILFKNDKKTEDKHPYFKGSIMVEGKEYWLSGWTKKTVNGDPMVSLSVQSKDKNTTTASVKSRTDEDIDDQIPF